MQSGRLWVSYRDALQRARVGAIDLVQPSAHWDAMPRGIDSDSSRDRGDPSDTGMLVTSVSVGRVAGTTATYNVSDPSAVTRPAPRRRSAAAIRVSWPSFPGGRTFLCDGCRSTAPLPWQHRTRRIYDPGPTAVAPDGAIAVGDRKASSASPGRRKPRRRATTRGGACRSRLLRRLIARPRSVSPGRPAVEQLFTVVESTSDQRHPVYQVRNALSIRAGAGGSQADQHRHHHRRIAGPSRSPPHLGITDSNQVLFRSTKRSQDSARRLVWSWPRRSRWRPRQHQAFLRGRRTRSPSPSSSPVSPVRADDRHPRRLASGVKVAAALSRLLQDRQDQRDTRYRVYHHTATLKDAVTVAPDQARRVRAASKFSSPARAPGARRHDQVHGAEQVEQASVARQLTAVDRLFRIRANFAPSANGRRQREHQRLVGSTTRSPGRPRRVILVTAHPGWMEP